jgi:hypothetical protein
MLAVGAGYAATVLRDIGSGEELLLLFRQLVAVDKSPQKRLPLATLSDKWLAASESLRFRGEASKQKLIRQLCNAALLRLGHAQQLLDRGKHVPPARPDVRSHRQIFGKIFESILLLAQAWALALGRTVSETRAFWTSQVASLSVQGWQQLSRDKAAATGREAHPDVWDQRAPVDWLQIIEPSMFSTDTSGTKHRTGKPRNGNIEIVQNFARSLELSIDVEEVDQADLYSLKQLLGPSPAKDSLEARFAASIFGLERQFLLGVTVVGCLLFSTLGTAVHPSFTFAVPALASLSAFLVSRASQTRAD